MLGGVGVIYVHHLPGARSPGGGEGGEGARTISRTSFLDFGLLKELNIRCDSVCALSGRCGTETRSGTLLVLIKLAPGDRVVEVDPSRAVPIGAVSRDQCICQCH